MRKSVSAEERRARRKHKASDLQSKTLDMPMISPLRAFPSKSETVGNMFLRSDVMTLSTLKAKKKRSDHWLDPSSIDPNFGISGNSKEASVKKSFRRIESNNLFMPPKIDRSSSFNIKDSKHNTKYDLMHPSKFLLVEESRMKELIRIEKILRHEREMIGHECAWLMEEENMSARFALPAVKYGVQDVCEGEKRNIASRLMEMTSRWKDYCTKQQYGRIRILNKNSYVQKLPLPQRAQMILQLREEHFQWTMAMERDTMMYEDDVSNLMNKYYTAIDLRADYDQYYMLANRFGIFSEEEYSCEPLPGRRYYARINAAAGRIQNRWHCYWPMQKLKRHKRSRRIQTVWRMHFAYKKWNPVYRFHKRIVCRDSYGVHIKLWKQYVKIVRCLNGIHKFRGALWVPKCVKAWRMWLIHLKEWRLEILQKMAVYMKQSRTLSSFHNWSKFVVQTKYLKTFMKRSVCQPLYEKWVTYARYSIHVKMLNKMAIKVQAHVRGYLARCDWYRKKAAVEKISYFGLIVLARKQRKIRERDTDEKEFEEWLPGELQRQMDRNDEREKKRLIRQQRELTQMEQSSRDELEKHLNSRDGKLQVKEIIAEKLMTEGRLPAPGSLAALTGIEKYMKKDDIDLVKKELLEECSLFCRPIHKHDFIAKNPIAFQCADISCGAIFSTEEQYHNHMKIAEKHSGKPPQYSHFHIMIRSKKGQQIVRKFIMRIEGIGPLANALDLWVAIQEWIKVSSKSAHYVSKALFIYENFLREHCNRPVSISFEDLSEVASTIERVKHREYEGFYKLHRSSPKGVRNIFGLDGVQFEAWTTENLIPGYIFQQIEWQSFLYLFEKLEKLDFKKSQEARDYRASILEIEKKQKELHFQDFLEYRERERKRWLEDFIFEDNQRGQFADAVIEKYINIEVSAEIDRLAIRAGRLAAFIKMQREQSVIEPMKMILDDVMFWCIDDISDELFNFYTDIMLKTMLEKTEFRKLLFNVAEMEDVQDETIKKAVMDRRNEEDAEYWFSQFSQAAINEEVSQLPLDPSVAAVRIQKHVRGMQGRKAARRIFVNTYCKRFDPSYGAFYYENIMTGESSWDRPHITQYLLPGSAW